MEPFYIGTIGTNSFVHYNKLSLTQGLPVYFWYVHVVLDYRAVKHNMNTFLQSSLLYSGRED